MDRPIHAEIEMTRTIIPINTFLAFDLLIHLKAFFIIYIVFVSFLMEYFLTESCLNLMGKYVKNKVEM